MTRLDPIADHPLLDRLDELAEISRSIESEEEVERDTIDWLRLAPARLAAGLREADPLLLSRGVLDESAATCEHAVALLQQYASDALPTSLTAAEKDVESVLAQFGPLVRLGPTQIGEAIQETLNLLARRSHETIAALEARVAEADTKAEGALATLAEKDAEITQVLTLLEQRTQDVGTRLTTEQARVDDIAANAQQALSDQLAETKVTATAEQDRQETAFSELVSSLTASAEQAQEDFADSARKLLAVIDDHEEKARRAVTTIGENALAGGFGAHADAQRKEANKWRTVTVCLGAGAVVAAVILVLIHVAGSDDVGRTLTLLGASGGLGGVAAYTGRQSSIHRHAEQTSRTVALELEALPAFLVELDEDSQSSIRKDIIDRLIVHPEPTTAESALLAIEDSPSSLAALIQLVKAIKS